MNLPHDLFTLRGVLFVEGIAATFLFLGYLGRSFGKRVWPARVLLVGFGGLLIYLTVIQVKAFDRQAPFDGYSWTGLIFATVFVVGMVWTTHTYRHKQ